MNRSKSYKRDYHDILPVQGINRELWRWARAQAATENRTVGEIVNELIDEYRRESARAGGAPAWTSSFPSEQRHQLSIRGIDRDLWRWLKAQSIMEGRYLGEIVNSLIDRYRNSSRVNE